MLAYVGLSLKLTYFHTPPPITALIGHFINLRRMGAAETSWGRHCRSWNEDNGRKGGHGDFAIRASAARSTRCMTHVSLAAVPPA